MTRFGTNMRWSASKDHRGAIERFFVEGLGCKATDGPIPALRLYACAGGESIGVYFVAPGEALSHDQMRNAAWLEFHVEDVAATAARLAQVGVNEFEYVDKAHRYFTAPNGQIFRLATPA